MSATAPIPRTCQWRSTRGHWFTTSTVCDDPPTIECDRGTRQRYVCRWHAGAHKRGKPPCTDANHHAIAERLR